MSPTAIESGDQTDFHLVIRLLWRQRRKPGHDPLQIAGRDGNVGVVDEQKIELRVGNKLSQCTDFTVGSQTLRAFDEPDGALGKFIHQFLDRSHGGIANGGDAKEQFILSCIDLAAMGAEGLNHPRVIALERFENAYAGSKIRQRRSPAAKIGQRCEQSRGKVADPSHREQRGQNGDGLKERVRHLRG